MTILNQTVLDVLLPGFTHHVDIGQGEDARISYGAGGLAQMVLPGKPPMKHVTQRIRPTAPRAATSAPSATSCAHR